MRKHVEPTNFEMLEQRLMMSANDAFAAEIPAPFGDEDPFGGDIALSDDSGSTLESARLINLNSRGAGRLVGRINYTQDIDLLRVDATQSGSMQAAIEIDDENPDLNCTLAIMSASGNNVVFERDDSGSTSVLTFQVVRGESYLICIFGDGQHTGKYTVNVATLDKVNTEPETGADALTIDEDTAAFNMDVLANDVDLDGDSIMLQGYTQADHGLVILNDDGTFNYIPDQNYNGSDSFSYTISDGNGGEASATVNLTVNAVNDTPAASDDVAETNEDAAVVISPLANDSDIDGDELTVISADGAAHGSLVVNGDGTITYTPEANYYGTDSFSYVSDDGNGAQTTATVTVTIAATNDSPVLEDQSLTLAEDGSITVLPGGTDVDGDLLSVISVTDPTNGTVVINGDNTLTYTPGENFYGSDSFTYIVSDGNGGQATATVNLTVTPVNDAPVVTDSSVDVDEDASVVIGILGEDVDGDELDIAATTQPTHGLVTVNGDGTMTYTPDANYNGADSFSYTVSDGNGGEAVATVSLSVAAVNDAPTTSDQDVTVAEDASVVINTLGEDIDGDALSVTVTAAASHGAVVVNGNGTLTYTPAANYNGADSFSYTVSDGNGGEAVATVSLTVTAVNDAPTTSDRGVIVAEDSTVVINALGEDIDGDTLSVAVTAAASHGLVVVNGDGTLTYTPAANYNGADSFSYTISDGNGGEAVATVSLTVTAVNDAPTTSDRGVIVAEDSTVVINALGEDIDGDTLSVAVTAVASHGLVVVNGDGTLTYTPAANYNGSDSFSYTVSDGNGGEAVATVSLTVTAVNDAPTIDDASYDVSEDLSVVISDLGTDVDGDALEIISVTQGEFGLVVINGDGTVSYTPENDYHGSDSFTYTIDDGNGGQATATISIQVWQSNDAPVIADQSLQLQEDGSVVISELGSDADGDDLSIFSVTESSHGTVTDNGDGTLTYTPAANYNGSDSFNYTVADGHGGYATSIVTLTVAAVNDLPEANDRAVELAEDANAVIGSLAEDVDGDTLVIITVIDADHGTVTDNGDGTLTYTPDANYNGSDSFSYIISDGIGDVIATVSLTVTAVNDAPTATDKSYEISEDTSKLIGSLGVDIDGDSLSLLSISNPAHGQVVDNGNGTLTYTPDANYNGADSFSYTISDGNGGEAVATVSLTVNAVNDVPTTSDQGVTVSEDASVVINALGEDIDGDTLSVSVTAAASHGAVVVNGDGTLTYTPDANYNGADSFSYTVSDGNGGEAVATVSLTVTSVNDAPTTSDRGVTVSEDASVVIAALGEDIDGDALSVTVTSAASHGDVVVNGNGTLTYTPATNYNGADSFSYTVSDGNGGEAVATVSLTVTAVNDAPTTSDRGVTVAEDASVVIAALGEDIDGDALSVSVTAAASHGAVVVNGDGTLTYTPDANYNGADSFSYTVSDGNGGEAVATVSLTVTSVNDAPTTSDRGVTVSEDASVVIAALSEDIDGDALSVTVTSAASHGDVVVNGNGTLTYTPAANYNGTDSFSYTVSDGNGGEAVATVSLTVTSVNDAPTTSDRTVTVAEDASVVIAALGEDIDGDTLSVSVTAAASHGDVVVNGDGTLTYTPDANYNGADSFSYTVSDGNGGEAVATVSLSVVAVNDTPTTSDRGVTVAEDASVVIDALGEDIDGDALSVTVASAASHGDVTVNGNGTLTYTPDANYNGADSFSYTVSDGNGGEAVATISLTVIAVNDSPTTSDQSVTVAENSSVVINALGEDIDGDALSVTVTSAASHGDVTVNGDGTLTYMPAANYGGSDSFSYTISDGNGGQAVATVSLTVTSVNTAPTANDKSYEINEDTAKLIGSLGQDDDGDTLTIISMDDPQHGTVTDNGNGTITYKADADYYGIDSFSYTLSDGNGGQATATVTMTVNSVNDNPTASDRSVELNEDSTVTISDLGEDPEGDILSVLSTTSAAHGVVTINGDGTLTYTPAANYNGSDSFDYTLSDGNGGQASATVNLTVDSVNDAPTTSDRTVELNEDDSVLISALGEDIDGDSLSVIAAQADHGVVTVNGNGTITYTPAANFYGSDSFSYTLSDGNGGEALATVTLNVASVNDAPSVDAVSVELDQDSSILIDVLAGSTDIEGDTLSVISVSGASDGVVTINGDGTLAYTPDAGFYGSDSFSFVVSDGNGGQTTAIANVVVNEDGSDPEDPFVPESGLVVTATAVQGDDGLTLIICGTDGDDTIAIDQLSSGIMLYSGTDGEFFEGDFAAVAMYGFSGSDWMRTTSTVTIDTYISGGDGDDQIYHNGLSGATLNGDAGDDLLVSIGGTVNTLTGGDGLDSYWNDTVDVLSDVSADETAARAVHSIDEFYQPYSDDVDNPEYVSKTISGQNFTDPTLTSASAGYVNYADSPLFFDELDYDDIRQGQLGDCYYLASLAAYAEQDEQVILQSVTSLGDGTFAVRFYQYDGTEVVYRMDADLPTNGSSMTYAKRSDGGEIWVPIMEKAYAYFRYNGRSYATIESGWMTNVYRELTGETAQMTWSSTKSDADMHSFFISELEAGHAVTMGSNYSDVGPIVGGHAYTLLDAYESDGALYITVYNPWGFDGRGGDSDGRITLTMAQFKDCFQQVTTELV